MKHLAGAGAVVTGAGSGIGLAIARTLAKRGMRLALVDVRPDRLADVSRQFDRLQVEHSVFVCDVASQAQVEDAVKRIQSELGHVQLLVNCAGVSQAGSFVETPVEDWEWLLGVNVFGTVYFTKALLPHMLSQDLGHIVNVCSSFGWVGFPEKSAYAASKFAVRGLSESLRMELRETAVGLTILYPGPVDSGLVRDGRAVDPAQQRAEMEFLRKRSLSPQRVAEAAIQGIIKNKDRVVVGLDYRLIDFLVRLSPRLARSVLGRFAARNINRRPPRSS